MTGRLPRKNLVGQRLSLLPICILAPPTILKKKFCHYFWKLLRLLWRNRNQPTWSQQKILVSLFSIHLSRKWLFGICVSLSKIFLILKILHHKSQICTQDSLCQKTQRLNLGFLSHMVLSTLLMSFPYISHRIPHIRWCAWSPGCSQGASFASSFPARISHLRKHLILLSRSNLAIKRRSSGNYRRQVWSYYRSLGSRFMRLFHRQRVHLLRIHISIFHLKFSCNITCQVYQK